MSKLKRGLAGRVAFAALCVAEGVEPRRLARLVYRARKAYGLGVLNCNEPGHQGAYERAVERFDQGARELGFEPDWPGLWPVLSKDGRTIFLPD